jgi:hypothetical protein
MCVGLVLLHTHICICSLRTRDEFAHNDVTFWVFLPHLRRSHGAGPATLILFAHVSGAQLAGTDFWSVAAAVNVTISGVPCVVLSAAGTGVVCRTPVMAGGLVALAVAGQGATGPAVTFDPSVSLPPASVSSVVRVAGGTGANAVVGLPLTGGGAVSMTGNNLSPTPPAKCVVMRTMNSSWIDSADCSAALAVLNASLDSNFCVGPVTWKLTSVSCTLPPSPTALLFLSVVTVVGDACKAYTVPRRVQYDPPLVTRAAGGTAPLDTSGGSPLVLTGGNFAADSGVLVGGVACTGVAVSNNYTTLKCTAPAGAGANVTLSLNSSAYPGVGVLQQLRLAYAPPSVSGLMPNGGPPVGGTALEIRGSGFAAGRTSVAIGSYPAAAVLHASADGTSLTMLVPPGHGSGLNVSVSVGGQNATLARGFSYSPPVFFSTIQSSHAVFPQVVDANGGAVVVNGSNFVPPSVPVTSVKVYIAGVACMGVVRLSDTSIGCNAGPMLVTHAAEVLVNVDGATGEGTTRVACMSGFYGPADGATCAPCPIGAACPGMDAYPLPLAGYSRVSQAVFVACVPPESCTQLDPATVQQRIAAGDADADVYANCATGYIDAGRFVAAAAAHARGSCTRNCI